MTEMLIISNVLLWGAVIVMGVVIFALVRQIGILYERVAPAGALMLNRTLHPGDPAPELDVPTLDGGTRHIGGASDAGRATLLFFLSPDCPVCKSLFPVLQSARRDEKRWLDVVLAGDGDPDEHRSLAQRAGLETFEYVLSELLGRSYGVGKLPYGILIDESGRISALGIINSREHLESLFEARERGVASIQEYMESRRAAGEEP